MQLFRGFQKLVRLIGHATCFIQFWMLSSLASAATTTPQTPNPETARTVLRNVVMSIDSALSGMTSNAPISGLGDTITYSLIAIVLAWMLVRALVEGGGINSIVAELVPVLASTAVVLALLTAGGIKDIVDSMDRVASALSGTPVSDLKSLLGNGISKGLLSVDNVLSMPSPFPPIDDFSSALHYGAWWILFAVAKIVTAVIVTMAVTIYIANITLAYFSVFLAIALAPLMVPFLIAPATQWVFDGWLKFLLSASFTKLVSVFILTFTSKLMDGLQDLSALVSVKPTDDSLAIVPTVLLVCMCMILIACLCAHLQMEGPKLAHGLLSGGGLTGFKAKTGKMLSDLASTPVGKNKPPPPPPQPPPPPPPPKHPKP